MKILDSLKIFCHKSEQNLTCKSIIIYNCVKKWNKCNN